MRLQKKHEFDDDRIDRSSHTAGMALDEIFLKSGKLIVRYVLVAERTESGCNSIDRFRSLVCLSVEIVSAMTNFFTGF